MLSMLYVCHSFGLQYPDFALTSIPSLAKIIGGKNQKKREKEELR
jgi:hypothetical protein